MQARYSNVAPHQLLKSTLNPYQHHNHHQNRQQQNYYNQSQLYNNDCLYNDHLSPTLPLPASSLPTSISSDDEYSTSLIATNCNDDGEYYRIKCNQSTIQDHHHQQQLSCSIISSTTTLTNSNQTIVGPVVETMLNYPMLGCDDWNLSSTGTSSNNTSLNNSDNSNYLSQCTDDLLVNGQQQPPHQQWPTTMGRKSKANSTKSKRNSNAQSSSNSNSNNAQTNTKKRKPSKSTYKHVPHREKPVHLVARRNARERKRVQAVNLAFVRLRKCIPVETRGKRMSKVKTLQRAIEYIAELGRSLQDDNGEGSSNSSDCSGAESFCLISDSRDSILDIASSTASSSITTSTSLSINQPDTLPMHNNDHDNHHHHQHQYNSKLISVGAPFYSFGTQAVLANNSSQQLLMTNNTDLYSDQTLMAPFNPVSAASTQLPNHHHQHHHLQHNDGTSIVVNNKENYIFKGSTTNFVN